MAHLRVTKIGDWVLAVHRRLASGKTDSLVNHERQLLTAAAIESQNRFADRAETRLNQLKNKCGVMADSADLVREERRERG